MNLTGNVAAAGRRTYVATGSGVALVSRGSRCSRAPRPREQPGELISQHPAAGSVFPFDTAIYGTVATPLPRVPGSVSRPLAKQGITVTDLDGPVPSLSSAQAVSTAREKFPLANGHPGAAYLVAVTDVNYGPDAGTGSPQPILDHRPAWLVVFDGVEAPILFPAGVGTPGANGRPYYRSTTSVFIDPDTGKFLLGV